MQESVVKGVIARYGGEWKWNGSAWWKELVRWWVVVRAR